MWAGKNKNQRANINPQLFILILICNPWIFALSQGVFPNRIHKGRISNRALLTELSSPILLTCILLPTNCAYRALLIILLLTELSLSSYSYHSSLHRMCTAHPQYDRHGALVWKQDAETKNNACSVIFLFLILTVSLSTNLAHCLSSTNLLSTLGLLTNLCLPTFFPPTSISK